MKESCNRSFGIYPFLEGIYPRTQRYLTIFHFRSRTILYRDDCCKDKGEKVTTLPDETAKVQAKQAFMIEKCHYSARFLLPASNSKSRLNYGKMVNRFHCPALSYSAFKADFFSYGWVL